MQKLANLSIFVAVIAIVLGIISRIMFKPIVVEARAYIGFAAVMLLLAIAVMLSQQTVSKK
jgi:hypothetical protein